VQYAFPFLILFSNCGVMKSEALRIFALGSKMNDFVNEYEYRLPQRFGQAQVQRGLFLRVVESPNLNQ
jgi:hypothetical protein